MDEVSVKTNALKRRFVGYTTEIRNFFPIFFIMVHHSVVSTRFSGLDCVAIDKVAFLNYFIPMTIVCFLWSFFVNIRWNSVKRFLWTLYRALLSTGVFVSWAFVCVKPFSCWHFNPAWSVAVFWLVHLFVGANAAIYHLYYVTEREKEKMLERKKLEQDLENSILFDTV
jgi:hypothetical protein